MNSTFRCSPFNDYWQIISNTFYVKRRGSIKVIFHVQITRVTSMHHSYFIYTIFLKKHIYKFCGEYFLNVSKQLEYKATSCIFLKIYLYVKLNAFVFCYSLFICWYINIYCSMLNRCLGYHFHHQNIEKPYNTRRSSRLIRTEWRYSLGLPRGDNHVKLRQ